MAYTTIDDPTAYFQTALYTGNASSNKAITNDGNSDLQPDWVWIKERSSTSSHFLNDSVRGAGKNIYSDSTSAEGTNTALFTSFDSDGFTVGNTNQGNQNNETYVAWQWKAGGSASSNSNGNITSSVSANTTAGFSIVTYTGTGSSATVGHGLGVAPNVIITKKRNGTVQWNFQNSMRGYNEYMALNTDEASQATSGAIISAVSSTTYSCDGNDVVNASSDTYISYCFAEKKGYTKFGSYTGNGNADGPFVYTGFKPAWVLCKKSSATGDWEMYDNKRNGFNGGNIKVIANANDAETGTGRFSLVSNGFKITTNSGNLNGSGDSFIYMAFAESPFVTSTGIPTTAR